MLMGRQSSGLTLSWALQQLNKQLIGGGSLDAHLGRMQPSRPDEALSGLDCPSEQQLSSSRGSSSQGIACMTPSSSDACTHPVSDPSSQQQHLHRPRPSAQLSVHWAEALEQHSQHAHAPHHTQSTPDKPCLKPQPSSFPFLEEAAQLDGLLRHPCTLVLAQLNIGSDGSSNAHAAAKKRTRLVAFGQ